MAWLTDNLRDCQEWKAENLELSTSSNEAAKLFDSAVRQYASWMEAEQFDGFPKTLEKMIESDPNFVMGKTLEIGMEVIGTKKSLKTDGEFLEKFEKWLSTTHSSQLSAREKLHARAVELAARGDFPGAGKTWDEILKEYPRDVLALKHAQTAYVFTGDSESLRDSPLRVWEHWHKGLPLYGQVEGMLAFGYEEMFQFKEAESHANTALEINRQDAWAAHALAHVMELQGRLTEGTRFMDRTSQDWKVCSWLAGHNYWHWALMHLENMETEEALDLFDTHVATRTQKGNMLDLTNSTSLLYRLQLAGVDVGDRWKSVCDACVPFLDDHVTTFNDAHLLMSLLNSKNKENVLADFQNSLTSYAKGEEKNASVNVAEDVGLSLAEGIIAYDRGDFCGAAEALIPIYDSIYRIGGSHAQRDVFSQLVIRACLKSPLLEHKKMANAFLVKRQNTFATSPLMNRLTDCAKNNSANL